ncbi:FAD-dependent oxidoreductase [Niabella pedocola]|uniref:FAD-dependent oxidoreductase n=1 Tax=Niabella pedocola TaxID=1752077 RepID=A0ABS8PX53_9BACT|nr:FAD-dependent oxidoreductase [Niabella pedocola]MCD2425404.1 FAD-dependent oxidoreductase [Niabella pedocola]
MKRRNFIELCMAGSAALLADTGCKQPAPSFKGGITGAAAQTGHLLRDLKTFPVPQTYETIHTVIAGAGISGLSAGRWLYKYGKEDFTILELEDHAGGNAANGKNEVSAYPLGAHYIPIPNNHLTEYLDFLQESNVLQYQNGEQLPFYNEEYLCADPQERLFINGTWQEGLVPVKGITKEEQPQFQKFFALMEHYRYLKDAEERYIFDIPVDRSSTDAAYTRLDTITMDSWLREQGLTAPALRWYVNYCTRDDFGCNAASVSAWVGIHYFASRKGKGTNATHSDVITWPQGNGYLVEQLKKDIDKKIRVNSLVLSVFQKDKKIAIHYLDVKSKQVKGLLAEKCILATPVFITGKLLKDQQAFNAYKEKFIYTPWVVANLKLRQPSVSSWPGMCWDNVIYNSNSLGYVDATHQLVDQLTPYKNITYYLPLTDTDATTARMAAYKTSYDSWCRQVLDDLKTAHPKIEDDLEEINITVWGHAMPKPLPGHIFGAFRKVLHQPVNDQLFFAHTDYAGISIFEEGFYQGIEAAQKIIHAS